MGKELYENNAEAKAMFEKANEILGFRITDIMFEGSAEDLKQTKVTQPAVFLHSVILAKVLGVNAHRIARTIHAHPSMHEAVMEAAEDALGCAIHM